MKITHGDRNGWSAPLMGWHCPFCGSKKTSYSYATMDDKLGYNRCGECQTVYRVELLRGSGKT